MLRGLAIALVGLAIVLGFLGWRLGQTDDPVVVSQDVERPAAPAPVSGHPVVVAARPLTPGKVIGQADPEAEGPALRVAHFPEPVADSYAATDELSGLMLTRALQPGDVVRPSSFQAGSMLAAAIPEGKRAVAVAVDEVIAGGGFVTPGDRVDVLFSAQAATRDRSQFARLLFRNLSLLAYGDTLDGVPLPEGNATGKRGGRTAVLAVTAEDAPALMLAEQSGRLRLAVVSANEQRRQVGQLVGPDALQQATLDPGPALLFGDLSELPQQEQEAQAERVIPQFFGPERREARLR